MNNFSFNYNNTKISKIKLADDNLNKTKYSKTDDSFIELNILITVILSFIDFITFNGNLLVIIAIISTKSLHTITNQFILSLAVADLLVSILVMPLSIITISLNHKWYLGQIICDLYISSDIMLCTASILNLCCISLDRYFAITRPLAYCRKRSTNLARKMIALVWVGSFLITCPPVFGWNDESRSKYYCNLNTLLSYRIFSSIGSFFLPCVVMIFVYFRIFRVIHEREKYLMKNSANFLKIPNKLQIYAMKKNNNETSGKLDGCSFSNFTKNKANIKLTSSIKYKNSNMNKYNLRKFGKTYFLNSSLNCNYSTISLKMLNKNTENFSDKINKKKFSSYLDERPSRNWQAKNTIINTPLIKKSLSKSYNDLLIANSFNSGSSVCMLNNQLLNINQNKKFDNQIRYSSLQTKFIHSTNGSLKEFEQKQAIINEEKKTSSSINSAKEYFDQKRILNKSDSLNTNSSFNSMQMIKKSVSFSKLKPKKATLKHSNSNVEQQIGLLKESKAAKTLSVLVGSFILAWGPFFCMYIIEVIFPNLICIEVVDIITWVGYLNSTFNPIIYAWYSQQFRDAFYRLTIKKIKTRQN
jgi:hypothetical protein